MRKLTFTGLAAALVLGLSGGALAGGAGVVSSASGGYGFAGEAAGSQFVVGPFTFEVEIRSDGSVHGRYAYTQVRDGLELSVSGPLTCATIERNQAWVGGLIEKSSRPSLVGLDMWFQVQDNGEPAADETPDMSSTVGAAGAGAAEQYCDDAPVVRFPFFLSRGNLQVRAGN